MIIKPGKDKLINRLESQLRTLYTTEITNMQMEIDQALEVLHKAFPCFRNNYFLKDNGQTIFNIDHSGQYLLFLYHLSRCLSDNGKKDLANIVYMLNRSLSSVDIFYGVKLPDKTFCDHPLGSVIGRGNFQDYFYFTQACTVGNNNNKYPNGDGYLAMFPYSRLIGNCNVGKYVILSHGAYVKDMDIPSLSIVYGQYPDVIIKPITKERFFEIAPFVEE